MLRTHAVFVAVSLSALVAAGCGSSSTNLTASGTGGADAGVSGAGGASAGGSGTGGTSTGGTSTGGAAGSGTGGSGTGGAAGSGTGGAGTGGAAGSGTGGAGTGGSAGAAGSSAGGAGGSGGSCAGQECTGFPTTWVRGCTNNQSCVAELHQVDCCGAIRAMGVNHSEAAKFCAAEYGTAGVDGCRASYPNPPGCSSNVITTDTGDTTTNPNRVGLRCANMQNGVGTCTTFVCNGSQCPVDNGTCGP